MPKFEWDDIKNLANQKKHGVSFEDATKVFESYHYVILSNYQPEQRFIAIGIIKNILVAVVFTNRNGKIRIISVRKARNNEKNNYKEIIERK